MHTSKITVTTNPVADQYRARSERIVEFSSPNGGGLISLRLTDDDRLIVDVYCCDDTVTVLSGNGHDQLGQFVAEYYRTHDDMGGGDLVANIEAMMTTLGMSTEPTSKGSTE